VWTVLISDLSIRLGELDQEDLEAVASLSLRRFGQLLGSNTVIGMAQKVGVTPPPPRISVRELIRSFGLPLQPTHLKVSSDPNFAGQFVFEWTDPAQSPVRKAASYSLKITVGTTGQSFFAAGFVPVAISPASFKATFEAGGFKPDTSYSWNVLPFNEFGEGPSSPLLTFHTPPTPGPPLVKPSISVSSSGSGPGSVFVVSGSGFSPNSNVRIRVVDDVLHERDFNQSADGQGKLNARIGIPCNSGQGLHFSATDGRADPSDITGVLFSNTFNTPCP
jgi:hypothetical protein